MDENNNLLTVREFAKAAGVSTQRIYKAMSNTLQPYVANTENGARMLKSDGLRVFGKQICNDELPTRNDELPTRNDELPTRNDELPTRNDELPTRNDELPTQSCKDSDRIDTRDIDIETLQMQLREKDEQLRRLEADFAKLKDEYTDMRVKLAEVEATLRCKDELIAEKAAHNETLQAALALQAATNTKQGKAITVQAETAPRAENEHDPTEKKHGLLWSLLHRGKE